MRRFVANGLERGVVQGHVLMVRRRLRGRERVLWWKECRRRTSSLQALGEWEPVVEEIVDKENAVEEVSIKRAAVQDGDEAEEHLDENK